MAIGLQNYPNISAANSTYPSGDIRDNDGTNNGTPFDREVYADIHQNFDKFLRLAGITPTGNPENEANGFQYIAAMRKIFGITILEIYDRSSFLVLEPYNTVVNIPAGTGAGFDLNISDGSLCLDLTTNTIVNKSSNPIDLIPFPFETIEGSSGNYTLAANKMVELTWDETNSNWIVTDKT